MNHHVELGLILSKILSGLIEWGLLGLMFVGWFLYDRLDKSNMLKYMRTLCKAFRLCLVVLIILRVIQTAGLFFSTQQYTQPTAFDIFFDWAFVIFFVLFYFKCCRYYLKYLNDNEIIVSWHIKKYFSLCKKRKHKKAYSCLQKASERKPDSVFIWSMMAMFNDRYFEKPELADEYLVKAQQALRTSDKPSLKDEALFEAVTGDILMSRDNIEDGLAHLKKAYSLDPQSFRKEHYEKALEWAAEDDEPVNPTQCQIMESPLGDAEK